MSRFWDEAEINNLINGNDDLFFKQFKGNIHVQLSADGIVLYCAFVYGLEGGRNSIFLWPFNILLIYTDAPHEQSHLD